MRTPHTLSDDAAADPRYCVTNARIAELQQRAVSIGELIPGALEAIGAGFGWRFGAFWLPEANGVLACTEIWQADGHDAEELEALTWRLQLRPGIGLPGRSWRRRDVVCARELGTGVDALRATAARDAGLNAAVAMPLVEHAGDSSPPAGVIEFFTDRLEPHDAELPDLLRALAVQLAVFVVRQLLEHELTQERPVQIREEILEQLWLAQTALRTGRVTQAARLLDESIEAAERISETS